MIDTPNYKKLIDAEVWAFIERTERCYPVDAVGLSIEEQRSFYAAMCAEFNVGRPSSVQVNDAVIKGDEHSVLVRRYVKTPNDVAAAHIIYIHGGGFVVGDLNSHDEVCAELCAETKLGVTSVDYRLSPEHMHPAAFNDCLLVVRHEAARIAKPLLLCGDSAGGTLCAAVSHHLRSAEEQSPIKGQVLVYPVLDSETSAESYRGHANAPMLTTDDVEYYAKIRVEGVVPEDDVSYAPLHDKNYTNLPPTLAVSAECDPLSDDARRYCEAINKVGGNASWRLEPGLVHGYLRARHSSSRASQSFKAIIAALNKFALNSI